MIALDSATRYENPNSLGSRLRRKRGEKIKDLIETTYAERGQCSILDVGGEGRYWRIFDDGYLKSRRVHVTLANVEYRPAAMVDLDPDRYRLVIGDGCNLNYPDHSFDIVHSNSVIEHVGDWARMKAFAAETRRLAPRYYVQMPYFWFPYEPHFGALFFHWLPEVLRVSMMLRRPMGHYPKADSVSRAVEWAQSAHLLDRRQFACLFPDSVVFGEKLGGLTKSLIAVRD